jgi:hypothetical protein
VSRLELWRVPVGRPESEWACLSAADMDTGASGMDSDRASSLEGSSPMASGAGLPPAPGGGGGQGAPPAAEGMGDIEDCPWHVSAPVHWDMYAYRLANAEPDL